MKITEKRWNSVVWAAIRNFKKLFDRGKSEGKSKFEYSCIDEIFLDCEKQLWSFKAPREEINIRLFAMALYCDKIYNMDFFKSAVFLRFADFLNFFYFESAAKRLISENGSALVVFWVIFRLSFKNFLPQNHYLPLEEEMKYKSLELSRNFVY